MINNNFINSDNNHQELLVGTDSWSVAELVHALVILAFFHALAGFCLGCGVNPEIDAELGTYNIISLFNLLHTSILIGHVTSDQSNFTVGHNTNPALGLGGTPGSDTDSENLSPICSPRSTDVSSCIIEHYMESTSLIQYIINVVYCLLCITVVYCIINSTLFNITTIITASSDISNNTQPKRLADTIKERLAEVSQEEQDEEEEGEKDKRFAESVSSLGGMYSVRF